MPGGSCPPRRTCSAAARPSCCCRCCRCRCCRCCYPTRPRPPPLPPPPPSPPPLPPPRMAWSAAAPSRCPRCRCTASPRRPWPAWHQAHQGRCCCRPPAGLRKAGQGRGAGSAEPPGGRAGGRRAERRGPARDQAWPCRERGGAAAPESLRAIVGQHAPWCAERTAIDRRALGRLQWKRVTGLQEGQGATRDRVGTLQAGRTRRAPAAGPGCCAE